MGKVTKPRIISTDDERFLTLEDLVQWTEAVITQAERISAAVAQYISPDVRTNPVARRKATHATHRECHFFAVAAYKLIEYRKHARELGLCRTVNFGEIDSFSIRDIKDLRDMREHVIDYFKGEGREKDRWIFETPDLKADAGTLTGTIIGGRLDYAQFSAAAERLLPALLAEPIPLPPASP